MGDRPVLGFVGAGKVGTSLARLWYNAGYTVKAVYSRTPAKANELAVRVGALVTDSADAVVAQCDLTLLTVTDDAIEIAASSIRASDLTGKAVIHTSGAHDASALRGLAVRMAATGSLHPIFPFADVETAVQSLPGAVFALEAMDERLRSWLERMVAALGGQILVVPPGKKAAYHAALVFASNYMVTLYAIAEGLLHGLGADRATAARALNPLMAGTVANLREWGVPDALTGPLVRGDLSTVAAHMEALASIDAGVAVLYRDLAQHSLPMLKARQVHNIDLIEQILDWGDTHATDNT
ncbi:MAG: DUF2520 domain-containing protein [Anaerolineae bacterium]|nr:DUF2520 domain-containing protein [Anaerolineae bacterium]